VNSISTFAVMRQNNIHNVIVPLLLSASCVIYDMLSMTYHR